MTDLSKYIAELAGPQVAARIRARRLTEIRRVAYKAAQRINPGWSISEALPAAKSLAEQVIQMADAYQLPEGWDHMLELACDKSASAQEAAMSLHQWATFVMHGELDPAAPAVA